jgi:hypothetical protein
MPMVRMRLTGSREDADSLINTLHGIEGIEHVEEVDDLVPVMRDDSSSSELTDDVGSSTYFIEVQAPNRGHAEAVKLLAERHTEQLGAAMEIVDEF